MSEEWLAARKRLGESIHRLERYATPTHSIDPQTGQFTRLDQEDTMTDLPRTVITLTGDRGPLHVAKGVLVNGSPVTVAEHGVDIDFGPDEVTTVTLRLLADEVHFVKAPTETGKPELEWLDEPVLVPHPDEALADWRIVARDNFDRAEKAEADLARVTDRYDALREDVEKQQNEWVDNKAGHSRGIVNGACSALAGVIAADDARAEGQS